MCLKIKHLITCVYGGTQAAALLTINAYSKRLAYLPRHMSVMEVGN